MPSVFFLIFFVVTPVYFLLFFFLSFPVISFFLWQIFFLKGRIKTELEHWSFFFGVSMFDIISFFFSVFSLLLSLRLPLVLHTPNRIKAHCSLDSYSSSSVHFIASPFLPLRFVSLLQSLFVTIVRTSRSFSFLCRRWSLTRFLLPLWSYHVSVLFFSLRYSFPLSTLNFSSLFITSVLTPQSFSFLYGPLIFTRFSSLSWVISFLSCFSLLGTIFLFPQYNFPLSSLYLF